MANSGFSNLRFLKSNCLYNVTPKIIATIQKGNNSVCLFSIIFNVYRYFNSLILSNKNN